MAILVVALLAFSSFTMLVSATDDVEEENGEDVESLILSEGETRGTITLGEGLAPDQVLDQQLDYVPVTDDSPEQPVVVKMADGFYSPARQEPGEAKIFLMDDDAENWMSGPWIEASHIETALNDGGYSFDVFRGGKWGGTDKALPSGDAGLSMIDDYEAIIWYSGWNTNILSSDEITTVQNYLDGNCGNADTFCVSPGKRNIIMLTQMTDWLDYRAGNFMNQYLHSDTQLSSYLIVGGTSNPMKGVENSIFQDEEYDTDSAGVHYLDRPCGIKNTGPESIGAFWYDARKGAADGHEYHAVQFPSDTYVGSQNHKAFHFADEIGVFNKRTDRADFFATILSWMEVTQESTKNVDMGIGGVDLPNHAQYWRSVEVDVELDVQITVTNYGMLPQGSTAVQLKLKNEFGQVLFDSTFDTRAFPSGHPMHVSDSIQNGDSIVFTFNKENDAIQREYDGLNPDLARDVKFTSAGMNMLTARVVHTGDQGSPNDYISASIGVGKWIDNMESFEDSIGPTGTFGDTTENTPSFVGKNMHYATSYDWDADGCGWAVDEETCVDDGHTVNKTVRSVFHEGKSSLGLFNKTGWYKTGANSDDCVWGDNSLSDSNCRKFAEQPNQDDYYKSPPMDLSAMEEVVIGVLYTGCMESGDYLRLQISKNGDDWTNVFSYNGWCAGEGSWYLLGGSNGKYQGYVLSETFYGKDDTTTVQFRFMADADGDENTEGSRPYPGMFFDQIVFRGTEKITRDVAVGDVTVDNDFAVKTSNLELRTDLWREINATVINAGESPWPNLPVQFSVTNLQGDDVSEYLDETEVTIPELAGSTPESVTTYGDYANDAGQKELFVEFASPEANTYYVTVTAIVPAGRDFFPWNNTVTIAFRVFDQFFSDNFDSGDRDSYIYTTVERLQADELNSWVERPQGDNALSGTYALQYAKEGTHSDEVPTTAGGRDDSLITQDIYDRDGPDKGPEQGGFDPDVNIDLRAAFEPILMYAIKWDLGSGDRIEVRASTDFNSLQKMTSGTWTVLKTHEDSCECEFFSDDPNTWHLVEISLEEFAGYQTWIDFRVVTSQGGGKGVLLDDLAVIGNEYRNNLDITDVDTVRYSAAGEEHDLAITVRGVGTIAQDFVTVSARITDSNGLRVWPKSNAMNYCSLPSPLGKGEEFTVSPDTCGDTWVWGEGFAPGIYRLHVEANRDNVVQVVDENPANNYKTLTIVLGAALLTGDQWTMGQGWSSGSYVWDATQDGSLTSEFFTVWNKKPFLVVEAEYDLIDASVKAQVRPGSNGPWYDIVWRATDQLSTLYSIPDVNESYYSELPEMWKGSSYYDNSTTQTFFADLGAVDEIGDGSGSLENKYIGSEMQIRLKGTGSGPSSSGTFTAFYPSVFGLDDYSVDVKEVSPKTQNGEPSSITGDMQSRTYTVKISNFGATSDSGVVDFVITAPDNSFVKLFDGTDAEMDSVLQTGAGTYVAVTPVAASWGGDRDDLSGGDQTAYIDSFGVITWPSGKTEAGDPTGWEISNPTKYVWDDFDNKPVMPDPANFVDPGEVMSVNIEVQVGFAQWAPPGTYSIQADARSWYDYDGTFTTGDSDGQATMIIAKPDLSINNEDVRYISHATGYGEGTSGWTKKTGGSGDDADPYFSFMFQVENTGTETVGTFRVGLLDFTNNPLGVQVGLYWTSTGWAIDTAKTTAHGASIETVGKKKFVYFQATASELGMSEGPGEELTGSYTFYLAVDTEDTVSESNENNNRYPVTITAVKEVNTVPSFGLSLLSMSISGLLAAIGIALRQKDE